MKGYTITCALYYTVDVKAEDEKSAKEIAADIAMNKLWYDIDNYQSDIPEMTVCDEVYEYEIKEGDRFDNDYEE